MSEYSRWNLYLIVASCLVVLALLSDRPGLFVLAMSAAIVSSYMSEGAPQ
jgi:hypothetical protein